MKRETETGNRMSNIRAPLTTHHAPATHPPTVPRRWGLTAAEILMVSFAGAILLGTLLLMLPPASVGRSLSFVEALFTATSATCVTGLTVVDTGAHFTLFGQIVILVLIQMGGLGIMTFSTFFLFLFGRSISMKYHDALSDTLGHAPAGDTRRLLKNVLGFTLAAEGLGALFLLLRFVSIYPFPKALYHAVFHAISAFCNAGFALYSESFRSYQGDFWVSGTLMVLIVSGGIGFPVLLDLRRTMKTRRIRSLSLHTKIVLLFTGILIALGAAFFFLLEAHNTLERLPRGTQFLSALFQSVTPRTAGFYTVSILHLTHAAAFFLIVWMFIGASSGSCGGGIKVSTFAVLIATGYAQLRNRNDATLFQRRIPSRTVTRAIAVVMLSISVILLFTMALLITESGSLSNPGDRGLFLSVLFEATSAFGTVGLSTGLTPHLTAMGKLLMALLMFTGRIGPLTIALMVGTRSTSPRFQYAEEAVMVG
ncbi:MAG: TrkH family potassium uptake protein [Candidatus Latescibacterota bacterium]